MRNKAKNFPYGDENSFKQGKPVQKLNMHQSEQMARLIPTHKKECGLPVHDRMANTTNK